MVERKGWCLGHQGVQDDQNIGYAGDRNKAREGRKR